MWAHSLIQSLAVSQGAVLTSWSVNTKTNLEKHIMYDIWICENIVLLFQLGTILSRIECTQNIPEKLGQPSKNKSEQKHEQKIINHFTELYLMGREHV
jgi:hypothetical protein